MDHMDWFDPVPESRPAPTIEAARKDSDKSISDLDREIIELSRVIRKGGSVFWRSAAKKPWYNQRFEVSLNQHREASWKLDSDLLLYFSFRKWASKLSQSTFVRRERQSTTSTCELRFWSLKQPNSFNCSSDFAFVLHLVDSPFNRYASFYKATRI